MHKLDMSLAEKAPRFQCVRCSPLRSCSGRPCIHSKGASLCSALLCSRVRNPERVSSERRPLSAWESIARALPRARLRISAGEVGGNADVRLEAVEPSRNHAATSKAELACC
ncbi:uncharacterized protein LOC126951998 [Macaca thibetana thibetana]|uniref:uncharacterized protein LOC126951998 n=1 Tax=Macaca thibetana thibetana TaxID=257877 RepID=UPI0005F490A7|nr:uncharacterized protein LOC105465682 isoform X2 [Macaca nemestrina]XP_050642207.1 uncharacterized protein LOC126951998 [Macaca thibetana thibetana]